MFEVINGKLEIGSNALLVPQIRDIWERDKSVNKDVAEKELSYIFLLYSLRSSYMNYPESIREEKVIKDVFGKTKWKPDAVVKKAADKFVELHDTHSARLLRGALKASDEISSYLNEVERSTMKFIDAKNVIEMLGKIGGVVSNLRKLKEEVDKESFVSDLRTRAGAEISDYEK